MNNEFQFDLDENALRVMKFAILEEEKKNARTHEISDGDMVKKLCKIIENEVGRLK